MTEENKTTAEETAEEVKETEAAEDEVTEATPETQAGSEEVEETKEKKLFGKKKKDKKDEKIEAGTLFSGDCISSCSSTWRTPSFWKSFPAFRVL